MDGKLKSNAQISRKMIQCIGTAILMLVVLAGVTLPVQAQTHTSLVELNFPNTGFGFGSPVQGRDGNLYGVAGLNLTAIYQATPAGALTLQWLASSTPGGTLCYSGMILGTDGNFYGTCSQQDNDHRVAVAFKFTPGVGTLSGTLIFLTSLATQGSSPSPLVQAADGNFYGTMNAGGSSNCGTAFKMTSAGVLTNLHTFLGGGSNEPCGVTGALIQGEDGNLYGASSLGGISGNGNAGTEFKMTTAGAVSLVHSFDFGFSTSLSDSVLQGTDGSFYGISHLGGATTDFGYVYRVTAAGVETDRHDSSSAARYPSSTLIQATDGIFYGVTNGCNAGGCVSAELFKLTGGGAYTTLYSGFVVPCGLDGCIPAGPLTQHTNGTFYGVTNQGGFNNDGILYSQTTSPALAPFVSIQQKSGIVGSTVNILGQGFTGTTAVKFGGVAGTFTVVSDTFMTAIPRAGAITGKVTVVESSGTLTSAQTFSVKAKFTSFTPASGPVGTLVTINGTGLTQVSKVTFNNVAATSFTIVSDSKITATVPTGATTGKIVVTNPAGTASSATNFTVN